jgi:hypothetical protein
MPATPASQEYLPSAGMKGSAAVGLKSNVLKGAEWPVQWPAE